MVQFLELEAVYIAMYVFALVITTIVTTRDFMPKGAFKKGVLWLSIASFLMIVFHYNMTTSRMKEVENIFNNKETIICENKMHRTISRSILISQKDGWILEDHLFKNKDFERDFHSSRCVDWTGEDIGASPQAPTK